MKNKIFLLFFAFLLTIVPTLAKEKIQFENSDVGVYVFKINTHKYGDKIKPFMTKKLTTPEKVYMDNCFDLVVNGGFFDVKNGKTVSYVTINNQLVGDVKAYKELTNSLEKQNRLDKVLSRAELR
ncbi:hypothetical protein IJ670_05655, partial [bacterium]|nr:hypothetical protein [bacterium]